MINRLNGLLAAITALLFLSLTTAQAGASVLSDFQSGGSSVDPCKYSLSDLQNARKSLAPDVIQYSPEIPQQLDSAIANYSNCSKKTQSTASASSTATGTDSSDTPTAPAPGSGIQFGESEAASSGSATANGLPSSNNTLNINDGSPLEFKPLSSTTWGLIAALILLSAILAALLVAYSNRISGLQRLGHSFSEAGFRISGLLQRLTGRYGIRLHEIFIFQYLRAIACVWAQSRRSRVAFRQASASNYLSVAVVIALHAHGNNKIFRPCDTLQA